MTEWGEVLPQRPRPWLVLVPFFLLLPSLQSIHISSINLTKWLEMTSSYNGVLDLQTIGFLLTLLLSGQDTLAGSIWNTDEDVWRGKT